MLDGCQKWCCGVITFCRRSHLAGSGHVFTVRSASRNQTVCMRLLLGTFCHLSRVGARAIEAHASRSMAVDVASPAMHAQSLFCLEYLHERHTRRAMCFEHHVIDNTSFENPVRHVHSQNVNEFFNNAKAVLSCAHHILCIFDSCIFYVEHEMHGSCVRGRYILATPK